MKLLYLIGALSIGVAVSANCLADDELPALLEELSSEARSGRVDALNAIAELGPSSDSVLRRVIRHLSASHPDEQIAALCVFERTGAEAHGVLPELVSHEVDAQLGAGSSLADLAITAVVGEAAQARIVGEISDYWRALPRPISNWWERPSTLPDVPEWIGQRPPLPEGGSSDVRVRLLVADLAHEHADVRWAALRGLELGLPVDEYRRLTALSSLDPDPRLRSRAMESLWRAGDDGQRAAALAYALYHRLSSAHIQDQLARGRGEDVLFLQIADVLADVRERKHQFRLCTLYATLGTPTQRQVRYLAEALGNAAPDVRLAAARAINRHDLWDRVVGFVEIWLSDCDPIFRDIGLRAGRHLGDRLAGLIPRLIELSKGGELSLQRSMAMRTIAFVPTPTEDLVEIVRRQLLVAGTDSERAICVWTLGIFGEIASPAIPTIFGFVTDRELRLQVVVSLKRIHPPDHPQQQLLNRLEAGVLAEDVSDQLVEFIEAQKLLRDATIDFQIRELEELKEMAR